MARNQFTTALNSYLATSLGCEDLKIASPGKTYSSEQVDIILSKWNFKGLTKIQGGVIDGRKLTGMRSITLSGMRASLTSDPSLAKIPSLNSAGDREDLLKSTLNVFVDIDISDRIYKHIYNVPVLVTSTGEIRFCGDEKNVAESCSAMQGIYDPINLKCKVDGGCKLKGFYTTLECNSPPCGALLGADINNKYTGGKSCPNPAVATLTQTSNWTSSQECGKKCTTEVQNTMKWYNCMVCPTP